jgi:hypothetical protein
MSYAQTCPTCGSARMDGNHAHDSAVAVSQTISREVRFAQVLNGSQWREKPISPPQDRDDLVPND